MKFFLISDNTDTQIGFRLAGVEGVVAHSRDEVTTALARAEADEQIGVVLLTAACIALAPDAYQAVRLTGRRPMCIQVPDRHSRGDITRNLDAYLSEAIGFSAKS